MTKKTDNSLVYKLGGIAFFIIGVISLITIISTKKIYDPYFLFFPLFIFIGIWFYWLGKSKKK